MSQLKLYISKRHTCTCGAIIFLGLRKGLQHKIFRVVARALAVQLYDLRCPPLFVLQYLENLQDVESSNLMRLHFCLFLTFWSTVKNLI